MLQNELEEKYFEWLYNLVCNDDNGYNRLSYRNLLLFLYNTEFTYTMKMDGNRAKDGIDFRYYYGDENEYSYNFVSRHLDNRPCNVLEMMIALAFKGEEQIMDDSDYGNRASQWFWNMIVSLGLGSMHDGHFNEGYVRGVMYRFLTRNYEPNGKGGLFTVENCEYDLRDMEIWAQFMWYLDGVLYS